MTKYELHPAANIFPMMTDDELRGLVEDMRENGQREPAVLWNGQLIDGRNRAVACDRLSIELDVCELDSDTDPIKWVLSHNLHRRHLNPSQKAMVAVNLKKLLEPEAKERKKQSPGRPKKDEEKKDAAKLPHVKRNGDSRDRAALMVGVSGKLVDAADKVTTNGSAALQQAVTSGQMAVTKAARIASLPKAEQNVAISSTSSGKKKSSPVSDKERAQKVVRQCSDKVVVARALFDECDKKQRSTIHRHWGEWLEDA